MTNQLPEPLVPHDVDLSALDGFLLNTIRVLGSELTALSNGDEFKAAVLLWCWAWKQKPAASLPDDDRVLANFAGYGRDQKGWQAVKTMALRGFIRCADGRLYHTVLAGDAVRAWEGLCNRRERTRAATEARRKSLRSARDVDRHDQRNDERNGTRDDRCNVDRHDKRYGDRGADRNEVPYKGKERKNPIPPPSELVAAREPGGGGAVVATTDASIHALEIIENFRSSRRKNWPNESRLEAPGVTLITEAQQWLNAGGTVGLINEILDRGMARRAATGKSAPASLAAFRLSLQDGIATYRGVASTGNGAGSADEIDPKILSDPLYLAKLAHHRTGVWTDRDGREIRDRPPVPADFPLPAQAGGQAGPLGRYLPLPSVNAAPDPPPDDGLDLPDFLRRDSQSTPHQGGE